MKNNIFNKYKNNNNKSIILFNTNKVEVGEIKYLPPVSKEWKNHVCLFNLKNLKNIPLYDISINSLIKAYFNLYFTSKFTKNISRSRKYTYLSLNRIFSSKVEVKHTNTKAMITLYTYNREKIVLLKKIKKLKTAFFMKLLKLFKHGDILNIRNLNNNLNKEIYKETEILKNFFKKNKNLNSLFLLRKKWQQNYFIIKRLRKKLILFKRFKLKLDLNKKKFEENLLHKLGELISQFYNKKIEFNIVNLKSIVLNTDLFTKILTLKIRRKKANVLKIMKFVLNKARLLKLNRIIEKSNSIRNVNLNLIENKYKNLHLQSIINEDNLDKKLNDIYPNIISDYAEAHKIIFNSIKYKNMGGIRLEVKGRLTKRYRADRAIFKVLWKGGLKNIDSSYKRLSSVIIRGSVKPNIEHSVLASKRRIGAFAVKGWISGK